MQNYLKILLFIWLTTFTLIACSAQSSTPILQDTQGNTFTLNQWQNKWVILHYWSASCHNCVEEVQELNRFYQHNKRSDLVFYGVSLDNDSSLGLKRIVKKMGIQFPVLLTDPASLLHLPEVEFLPTTFIISPQGKLIKTLIGAQTEQSLKGHF